MILRYRGVKFLALGIFCFLLLAEGDFSFAKRSPFKRFSSYFSTKSAEFVSVKIKSLRAYGKIDQKNLRLSIQNKLSAVKGCYLIVNRRLMKLKSKKTSLVGGKPLPVESHSAKLRKKNRFGLRVRRKEKRVLRVRFSAKRKLIKKVVVLETILNMHGRSLRSKVLKSELSASLKDCFLWFFQGQRFYPPEGKKNVRFQVRLIVTFSV